MHNQQALPYTHGGKQAKREHMPPDDCLSSGNTDGPLITAVPFVWSDGAAQSLSQLSEHGHDLAAEDSLEFPVSPGCALTAISPASTKGHLPFPTNAPVLWTVRPTSK